MAKKVLSSAALMDKSKGLGIVFILILSMALGFVGGIVGKDIHFKNTDSSQGAVVTTADQKIILNESQLISDIAKQVGQSVVSVNVTTTSQQMNFFGYSSPIEQEGAGTGILLSADGYVLTNRHVVPEGTSSVSVTLSDGTTLDDVEIIGRTNSGDSLDVAFLKIGDTKGITLVPATIGDSSQVQVGDKVVAIGNALGQFQNTVTSGIISGFGRSVRAGSSSGLGSTETLQNLFQTDAAINEGNSGGPLVNINGEVIGINTAVAGGSAQNIGFAIPINDAKGLIESVLKSGTFARPYLGVRYVTLTDDYAYYYNLPVKRGAYIAPSAARNSVLPDSPASKAGLQEKDIITKIGGVEVDENHSLTSLIGGYAVGDKVSLTILRGGDEQTIEVTLEASPN